MITFNSNDIIVGYIKEFLATFNLPKYTHKTWTGTDSPSYYFNKFIPNKTKNLKIDSNIYDSYTHEYLGQYLRFYRDYKGIDLMPLYNCFNNNTCDSLDITVAETVKVMDGDLEDEVNFNFKTSDSNYKIYMVPVIFGKQYTFAIDSFSQVEICCGIYGDHQNKTEEVSRLNLPLNSYQKFSNLKFSNPVIIDLEKIEEKLLAYVAEKEYDIDIYNYEQDLKLFIKVPIENTSSIVLLEGSYLAFNDTLLRPVGFTTEQTYGSLFGSWDAQNGTFGEFPTVPATADKGKPYTKKFKTGNYMTISAVGNKIPNCTSITANYDTTSQSWIWTTPASTTTTETLKTTDGFVFRGTKWYFVSEIDPEKLFVKKYAYKRIQNCWVTNYDDNELIMDDPSTGTHYKYIPLDASVENFKPITPLQLLRMNTGYNHPFADRLIEYILGNAITDDDEIADNVSRAQAVIGMHYITKTKELTSGGCIYTNEPITFEEDGLWEAKIRPIVYDSMQKDAPNNNDINHDILGYIDKDIEKFYTGTDGTTKKKVSILNVDLYDDMYKDSKED